MEKIYIMETISKFVAITLLISMQTLHCIGQASDNKSLATSTQEKSNIEKSWVSSANGNDIANKKIVLSTKNNTNETDTFSFAAYLCNNPDDFSVKYQAYLRIRLLDNGITSQEKLETEVAVIKDEIAQNKTDYTKIAFKDKEKSSKKEEVHSQIIASTSEIRKPTK